MRVPRFSSQKRKKGEKKGRVGGEEAEGGERADYGQQVRSSFGDREERKPLLSQ